MNKQTSKPMTTNEKVYYLAGYLRAKAEDMQEGGSFTDLSRKELEALLIREATFNG